MGGPRGGERPPHPLQLCDHDGGVAPDHGACEAQHPPQDVDAQDAGRHPPHHEGHRRTQAWRLPRRRSPRPQSLRQRRHRGRPLLLGRPHQLQRPRPVRAVPEARKPEPPPRGDEPRPRAGRHVVRGDGPDAAEHPHAARLQRDERGCRGGRCRRRACGRPPRGVGGVRGGHGPRAAAGTHPPAAAGPPGGEGAPGGRRAQRGSGGARRQPHGVRRERSAARGGGVPAADPHTRGARRRRGGRRRNAPAAAPRQPTRAVHRGEGAGDRRPAAAVAAAGVRGPSRGRATAAVDAAGRPLHAVSRARAHPLHSNAARSEGRPAFQVCTVNHFRDIRASGDAGAGCRSTRGVHAQGTWWAAVAPRVSGEPQRGRSRSKGDAARRHPRSPCECPERRYGRCRRVWRAATRFVESCIAHLLLYCV